MEKRRVHAMVLGYLGYGCFAFVTTRAVDADAFRAAHGEIFGTFSKIQPLLAELRAASGEADFCKHMEAVVLASPAPDAEGILSRRREALRAAAKRGTANEAEDGASSNGPRPARAPA